MNEENSNQEVSVNPKEIQSTGIVKTEKKKLRFRENPWIISTIALAVILVGVIIFGSIGGVTGNVVNGESAAQNLISFIEGQSTQVQPGDVELLNVEQEGQLYRVDLKYQGNELPVYVSLDGKFLVTDLVPLSTDFSNVPPVNNVAVEIEAGDSPVKGDANAPITIIEFSDYQCPFCKRFYTDTLPQLEEKYIDEGIVKLVYKDFPLDIHPEAEPAAIVARCVREQKGDDSYFKMHDKLFENQASLNRDNYVKWAMQLGVNKKTFEECLDNSEIASAVQQELAYGASLGVTGTPAFFVNGNLISGAQPYSVFEVAIEAELTALG